MTEVIPLLPLISFMACTGKTSPCFISAIYPNIAPPFVDRNSWRHIEDGAKSEYRIIRNLCSWAESESGYISEGVGRCSVPGFE